MNKIPGFRKLTERLLRNIKPEGNQNGTISLKIISQPKEHGNNCEYIGAIHTANQAGGITDVFGTFTFTVKVGIIPPTSSGCYFNQITEHTL
jgi:hypothetical protein